ncbi:nucleoside recognition domain-containing protein [Paenibacillus senegalensis]|uniref:nucleoside recognition domain-containing protein n=1 Tax=Paenibacillus senegalensis TaxID=1465766 RepID=UPI0002889684|nr:nucleoside recognition domain-containing protein [Paenibacillus senegalensis]
MASWFHPQSRSFTLLVGALSVILIAFIIIHPDEVFQSSLAGLKLWWDFVFPGLFPFLMLSEILLGLGVIHALGAFLEPWMRLVFRLPGAAGWAFTLGMAGGFPAGSSVTGKLVKQRQLKPAEAQRLWSVSHLCSPMLMIAVIGVGFLSSVERGFFIAVIHYAAAVATALVLLAFAPRSSLQKPNPTRQLSNAVYPSLWASAANTLTTARREDGRTFGKLLGDSVTTTAQTLLSLGGFIMLFSVIHQIVKIIIEPWLTSELLQVLLAGLLEPHLGVYAAAHYTSSALFQTALIGAILGWSGLSLHAQARSLTSPAGLRYPPFMLARLLHAGWAVVLTIALWKPAMLLLGADSLDAASVSSMAPVGWSALWLPSSASIWPWMGKFYLTALGLLLLASLLILCTRKLRRRQL